MNFKQWKANGGYDHLAQFAAWIGALEQAYTICRDVDDCGEWGEAAGRCADAIKARIESERRQMNAGVWDHERPGATDRDGGSNG